MSTFIDCFRGVVGVQSCSQQQLQFDIAKLPGISIESIEKIRDSDTDSYIQAINDVVFRAVYRIKNDMFESVKLSKKPYNLCIGRIDDNLEVIAAGTGYGGVFIKIVQSKYILLRINSLKFYTDGVYNVNFLIVDVRSNVVLQSIPFETVAGENEILVNELFYAQRYVREIAIVYDLATAAHVKSWAKPCYDGCNCECDFGLACGCNSFTGYLSGGKTFTTYGLAADITIECSFERFLCNSINGFSEALWYAAGIEYFDELKGSPVLNKFTKTKQEDWAMLRNSLKSKYTKSLQSAISNTNFNDNCCFQCDTEQYHFHYARP